jgi:hypothetical protein
MVGRREYYEVSKRVGTSSWLVLSAWYITTVPVLPVVVAREKRDDKQQTVQATVKTIKAVSKMSMLKPVFCTVLPCVSTTT